MRANINQLEILDLLDSLVEKSLVVWDAEKGRYRLLETVRQYAADRALDSNETDKWRDRHLNFFAKLGFETGKHERSADQMEWFDRVEADHDNIRAALRWSLTDPRRVDRGVELAGGIWRFWRNRGFPEAKEWLPKLLEHSGSTDSVSRANVLRGLCSIQVNYGELDEAEATARESLAISERIADHGGVVYCYDLLGQIGNMRRDYESAYLELQRGLEIARANHDLVGLAGLLNILGINRFLTGNMEEAKALYRESAEAARRTGNSMAVLIAISNASEPAILAGDFEEVDSISKEAIRLIRDSKAWFMVPAILEYLAIVASHNRQFEKAATLWGSAERMRVEFARPIYTVDLEMHESQVRRARSEFGNGEAFEQAWNHGRRMSLEVALAFAMAEPA